MPERRIRVAVVGAGEFGRNHARVYRELEGADLAGLVDGDAERAAQVAAEFGADVIPDIEALRGRVDAASLAVPTAEHAAVGIRLLEMGIDVLVEKPMASSLEEADALIQAARRHGRILQVGHVERFNPAVLAVEAIVNRPLFFEVQVGIPVLTDKVDIAHARLEFAGGAVANVTASRVSTERVRKMRFFQHQEYISLDYARRDALRVRVAKPGPQPEFAFEKLHAEPVEPLRAELQAFAAGRAALELADRVMASILEHARSVQLGAFAKQSGQ